MNRCSPTVCSTCRYVKSNSVAAWKAEHQRCHVSQAGGRASDKNEKEVRERASVSIGAAVVAVGGRAVDIPGIMARLCFLT